MADMTASERAKSLRANPCRHSLDLGLPGPRKATCDKCLASAIEAAERTAYAKGAASAQKFERRFKRMRQIVRNQAQSIRELSQITWYPCDVTEGGYPEHCRSYPGCEGCSGEVVEIPHPLERLHKAREEGYAKGAADERERIVLHRIEICDHVDAETLMDDLGWDLRETVDLIDRMLREGKLAQDRARGGE